MYKFLPENSWENNKGLTTYYFLVNNWYHNRISLDICILGDAGGFLEVFCWLCSYSRNTNRVLRVLCDNSSSLIFTTSRFWNIFCLQRARKKPLIYANLSQSHSVLSQALRSCSWLEPLRVSRPSLAYTRLVASCSSCYRKRSAECWTRASALATKID